MRFAVVNTPVKVGRSNWERCWRAAASRSSIHGQNEILTKAQKNSMLALCKKNGYGQYGIRQCPNPVYWNKRKWIKVRARVHRIHPRNTGWRARRWPGYNSARYVNEVILQRRRGSRQVAVLNLHWVPPAGLKVDRKWRKAQIRKSKRLLRRLVRKHLRAGRAVLVMGDFNLPGPFKMPEQFRWLSAKFIDKVGVGVPSNREITSSSGSAFPAPTDHKHGGLLGVVRYKKRK